MYKNKNAFTFVELIVTITILAILASIGFGAYQTYLTGGRDTNRLVQLNDINDGLEILSVSSRLPLPEDLIEIQANGNTFAYQGFAGESVIQAIGYDGGGKDIEYGTYLTYMLGDNQRDFQLMTHISDSDLLSHSIRATFADNSHYQGLFPKVIGQTLGIIVEDITNIPLQVSSTITDGKYDVVSGGGAYKSYLSDINILRTSEDDMTLLISNKSCKRIKDLGKDSGSGIYTINPTGAGNIRVYCDMENNGGGWTYAGFIHEDASGTDIYFDRNFGGYSANRSSSGSSYMLNMSDLGHKEALILYNTANIQEANNSDNLLQLRYQIGFPGMYAGDIMTAVGNGFSGPFGSLEYRSGLDEDWNFTNNFINSSWGFRSTDNSDGVIFIRGSGHNEGVYKYSGAWGDNPSVLTNRNAVWIYVK